MIVLSPASEAYAEKRRFSVTEYERMAEAGILGAAERTELINGDIFYMSPAGSRHAACIDRLNLWFVQNLSPEAIVRVQNPVYLDAYSQLEPDIALLKPRADFYADCHPRPGDIQLIVEIADSSLAYDSQVKLPLYASAGIPEVWILNLRQSRAEIYTEPLKREYLSRKKFPAGSTLISPTVARIRIAVDTFLGR